MDIEIEREEQEEGHACFDKCFDDEVIDFKAKKKTGSKFGAKK